MKKTISMDSGNFSLSFSVELKPEVLDGLIEKGLKYEVERAVLSKTYLALAGIPGKRAGKVVLPKGYERSSLEFNEVNAAKFKEQLVKHASELGTVSDEAVNQWFASVAESKFEDERLAMGRHESKGDLDVWMADVVKFKGDTHTDDGEDYSIEALNAVRAYAKFLKANM